MQSEYMNKSLNTSDTDSKNRQILELEQKIKKLTQSLESRNKQFEDEKNMLYREIDELSV